MATLEKLPTEILLDIIWLLSIQDLTALSLQCRQLCKAVEMVSPREYRRIRLYGIHLPSAYNLFCTILENPIIGSYVREIATDSPQDLPDCDEVVQLPVDKEPLLKLAITKAGFTGHQAEQLMRVLLGNPDRIERGWGFRSALAGVLLAVCPNVEILRAAHIWNTILGDIFKLLKPSYLPHLGHADLVRDIPKRSSASEYTDYDFLATLKHIAKLPSVKSVVVRGIQQTRMVRPAFLIPGSSNIKKLDICYSLLTNDDLYFIIRHSKVLEEFKLSSGQLAVTDDDCPSLTPKLLGKALLYHKSTLKVLDLDVDNALESYTDEGEEYDNRREDSWHHAELRESRSVRNQPDTSQYGRTIGPLHDFTALKRLSIGVKTFLGPQADDELRHQNQASQEELFPFRLIKALPPNLEYLCVSGYVSGEDSGYTSQIEEFMANKDQWPPNLEEIHGIKECLRDLPIKFEKSDESEGNITTLK